jgi:lipid-binding SYLF domain-containing protein
LNKELTMDRRQLLVLSGAALAAACSSTPPTAEQNAVKRREIDSGVTTAMADLATNASARQMAGMAKGILVFPKVVTAGLLVGGSYGQGSLRKGNTTAGYYSISSGSVGLLAGAQTKTMYVLFMTQDALNKFEASEGWTVGADASVVMADTGAEARVDSRTAQAPVVGYVRNQSGFMANLSIDGTKFNKLKL